MAEHVAKARQAGKANYGTQTPCVSKSVLSNVVAAWPSPPPSWTLIVCASRLARLASWTAPGKTEFAVVRAAQVPRMLVSGVLAEVTPIDGGMPPPGAASVPPLPPTG